MKTVVFVTGVSVGALSTVGVAIGAILFSVNKITDGGVAELFGNAIGDLKEVLIDSKRESHT